MDIEAVAGDITTQRVEALVNAANSSLMGGGGVDGAIHRAAGPGLLAECMELRRSELPDGLPVGEAVPTAGHDLEARWVIHTVGPNRHRGQTDPEQLAACFTSALEVAQTVGARTLAVPAVGAGVFGWDGEEVARIAVGAVRDFAGRPEAGVELVRFVLRGDGILAAFTEALAAG